jgi:hypothetical protein
VDTSVKEVVDELALKSGASWDLFVFTNGIAGTRINGLLNCKHLEVK